MKSARNVFFYIIKNLAQNINQAIFLILVLHCSSAFSHGGVFQEDDLCLIQIGFYKAHFTIYQPQLSKHKEFCEDIPSIGESIFVMEYIHSGLRDAPVELRIIHDVLKKGRFFKEEDLKKITDLNKVSVFYQNPSIQQDGVLLALHQFEQTGNYIGIVTAYIPGKIDPYIAVFPFRVGSQSWGYIPLFIAIALFLQLNYWLLNGGYKRIRNRLISTK